MRTILCGDRDKLVPCSSLLTFQHCDPELWPIQNNSLIIVPDTIFHLLELRCWNTCTQCTYTCRRMALIAHGMHSWGFSPIKLNYMERWCKYNAMPVVINRKETSKWTFIECLDKDTYNNSPYLLMRYKQLLLDMINDLSLFPGHTRWARIRNEKSAQRHKHCVRTGCSKVRTTPARPLSQTNRQDRLQYTVPQLASAQCNYQTHLATLQSLYS